MGGIRTRLNFPDFLDHIAKFDIVCFQETKIDDSDVLFMEEIFGSINFMISLNNRFKLNNFRSGGLAFAYKSSMHII